MLGQIEITTTAVLQICVFPLLAALWLSLTKRIDRLERKIDGMPSKDLCTAMHEGLDVRLRKVEGAQ